MASAIEIRLTISGKGGHAAYPHKAVDPILVTAHVLLAVQTIVSRETNPLDAVVLTFATIHGGSRHNIIPEVVTLSGTIRALKEETRNQTFSALQRITNQVCAAMGATCELEIMEGVSSGMNDPILTELFLDVAKDLLGAENVQVDEVAEMGAEDFYNFGKDIPAVIFNLGIANKEEGITFPCHHPQFDIDEDALPLGVALLATTALKFLQQHPD